MRQLSEFWPRLFARLHEQVEQLDVSDHAPGRAAISEMQAHVNKALTHERVAGRGAVFGAALPPSISNGTKTTAMVPLGDMLDHSPRTLVEWRIDDAAGTFTILSL